MPHRTWWSTGVAHTLAKGFKCQRTRCVTCGVNSGLAAATHDGIQAIFFLWRILYAFYRAAHVTIENRDAMCVLSFFFFFAFCFSSRLLNHTLGIHKRLPPVQSRVIGVYSIRRGYRLCIGKVLTSFSLLSWCGAAFKLFT